MRDSIRFRWEPLGGPVVRPLRPEEVRPRREHAEESYARAAAIRASRLPTYAWMAERGLDLVTGKAAPPDPPEETDHHQMKAAREAAGLSRRDIARACGVSTGTIGAWECGDRRPPTKYHALIRRLTGYEGDL